jgi:8-oxo-dGTP pyrophosphatase MutT (NUDIX family)
VNDPDPERGLYADAVALLSSWAAPDAAQDALRREYLAFLAAEPGAMGRACRAGHLTASALLVDAARGAALLTLHPKVGRWLQLGGHCEPGDATLAAAARREVTEEGGILGVTVDPVPLDLDIHPIECVRGIPNRHLDVRFLAHAPPGAEPVRSAESDDLRWWPLDALPGSAETDGLLRMAARAAERLA